MSYLAYVRACRIVPSLASTPSVRVLIENPIHILSIAALGSVRCSLVRMLIVYGVGLVALALVDFLQPSDLQRSSFRNTKG